MNCQHSKSRPLTGFLRNEVYIHFDRLFLRECFCLYLNVDPKAFNFPSSLSQSQLIAVFLLKYNLKVTLITLLDIITPRFAHEIKSPVMLPWLALVSIQLFGLVERSLPPFRIRCEICHSFYFQDSGSQRKKCYLFFSNE